MIKNLSAHAGDARDVGSIPGSGRSPGVGNDKPPQYPCPENSVDSGAWQVTVHGVAKELDTAEHGHMRTLLSRTSIVCVVNGISYFMC